MYFLGLEKPYTTHTNTKFIITTSQTHKTSMEMCASFQLKENKSRLEGCGVTLYHEQLEEGPG